MTLKDIFKLFLLVHEAGLRLAGHRADAMETHFERSRKSGWSDDPDDPGGATLCGVTIGTYKSWCKQRKYPAPDKDMLKSMPYRHWSSLVEELFWDKCHGDEFKSAPIAELLVDWVWASGPGVIREFQKILGVKADGLIGPKTLAAVNSGPQQHLFNTLMKARVAYIENLCVRKPTLAKYRRGWLRRLNNITWEEGVRLE